ncbi:MAG: dihydrodipicolinate synthase family protein, partial [Chloroflexota bacterium]|nr:dihydrodipicolinate synthase family protein [Chloroflexota bacterium]
LVVTPMHPDYSINYEALRQQIDWCFRQGATGITATPSIGEFPHLNRDERIKVMEVTLEQTREHGGVALATTAGVTTLEALDYTKLAAQMGYDYAVVIAPYYWKVGELEVLRHFNTVADEGGLPLVIYHNPALSKFHISPKFAGKIAEHPNIVAIKEVETDLQHLEALVEEISGKMVYLQTFRAYLTGRLLGSAGGTINVFAIPACVAIDRAWAAGDVARAELIQRRLNHVFPRGGEAALGAIGMTKVCASVATGIQMGPVRPPYMAPDDAEERLTRRLPELAELLPAMRGSVAVGES